MKRRFAAAMVPAGRTSSGPPAGAGSCTGKKLRSDVAVASRPPYEPEARKKKTLVVFYRDIDSTVSVVGRALLPVKDDDGQECPSYKQLRLGSMNVRTTSSQMKFQLSTAPGCRPPDRTGKKLQSRDVAVASVPPCSFLRAYGSKNGGTEATATVLALSNSKSIGYLLFSSKSENEVSG